MSGQFAYPQDREESSAAKVAALESLSDRKGRHHTRDRQ